MVIDFENDKPDELPIKARAVLGVPEEYLTDEVISSPVFIIKASKYINRKISDYEGLEKNLLDIAFVYYVCYLLCTGMYSRLPKQMENVNTKTVLQSTDWYAKALDCLEKCDELIDEAIEELDLNEEPYSLTMAALSEASEYPNTNI